MQENQSYITYVFLLWMKNVQVGDMQEIYVGVGWCKGTQNKEKE